MGSYKHQKGYTPDHVDSSQSNAKYEHMGALDDLKAKSDTTKKKLTTDQLDDSLTKYGNRMNVRADRGDVKGTQEDAKKYVNFSNQYQERALEKQEKMVKDNRDSVKKYGAHEASVKGKLKSDTGFLFGAEIADTADTMAGARKRAKEKEDKERRDIIKAKAKP